MGEIEKSEELLEGVSFALNNRIYLFQLIFYTFSPIFLFYLIFTSSQEIIHSKLIKFIINFYLIDKPFALTTFAGFVGVVTILIGYLSSENGENRTDREGKLWFGIVFWHRNFLMNVTILILILIFAKTYYGTLNNNELVISFLLIIVVVLMIKHLKHNLKGLYNWDTLENKGYKIHFDLFFGISTFEIGLLLYIYYLKFFVTSVFIILNSWMVFFCLTLLASFKSSRTDKTIVKYTDNKEECAYLVRIRDGFVWLITKTNKLKQINLSEIKEMNYDRNYIENFQQLEKNTSTE